jgi:hypothetical protein
MTTKYPTLRLTGTAATAMTYRFRANDRSGWAICTVNDATGELAITSDWGNWSYIWNPRHLGRPSLTHFIGDRSDYDYLANKLLGRADCWVLDADATIATWRKRLAAQRLEAGRRYARVPECLRTPDYLNPLGDRPPLTPVRARAIWEALGSLFEDESNESIFIEHAMQIDGIGWISERPWEDTQHRTSHDYQMLVETILPAIAEACALEAATRPGTVTEAAAAL